MRARSAWADVDVLARTLAAVVAPGLAPPPTLDEIRARLAEDPPPLRSVS